MTTAPSRQVRRRGERKGYRLFKTFLARVWSHLNLPNPTAVQNDIAEFLQFGPKRCIIEAFRGVGKSWVTCAFVVWCLLNDPQKKIMIVSAGKDRADANSYMIKRLINELPECSHLRPDTKIGQRDRVDIFDVGPATADASPSVKSVGIRGQITGSRADIIVGDDIEVPKNSFTAVMREQIAELIKEFDAIIKPEREGMDPPRIIYLGTPQTEMSIYNRLPERGYVMRVWPSEVPDTLLRYQGRLAPFVADMVASGAKPGAPVDPERFGSADLKARKLSYGRSGYALQFMLDTSLSDADKFPLKLEDLIAFSVDAEKAPASMAYSKDPRTRLEDLQPVGFSGDYYYRPMYVDEAWMPFQGAVMSIDPSGRGTDETSYAVLKMLHGRLYLVASGGFRDGYTPETLEALAQIARKHRVHEIVVEPNYGGGMFGALFKPILNKAWPCTMTDMQAIGQKEVRIITTLEPVIQQHRLVVDRAVIEADLEVEDPNYSLFYQLTRITRDRGALAHDDRLEALSMAVRYWVDKIDVDMTKAAQSAQEDLLEADLERFIEDGSLLGEMFDLGSGNWSGA